VEGATRTKETVDESTTSVEPESTAELERT
jgi:hypothetical protein